MKMRIFIYITVLISVATLAFTSCERRQLEDNYFENAKIPISVNWDSAGISPQNVSVLFYDENDNGKLVLEHRFENNNNPIQSYADVPIGKYTVVIFNEIRDQIENVGVRGYDNISTLEFYTKENKSPIRAKSTPDSYIAQPDYVAVKVIRGFEVNQKVLNYTRSTDVATRSDTQVRSVAETLVGVHPVNIVRDLNVTVHVEGLHNARMPALVDLHNVAGSYFVGSDMNSTTPSTIQFTIDNRKYDEGSDRDGTIFTGTNPVRLFGVLGTRGTVEDQPAKDPILLDMFFMLVDKDKTVVNREKDVTDEVVFEKEPVGSLNIEVNSELTTPLPDVKPQGSSDAGFGSDLRDWEEVDVPLTNK